ncbi:hypothetical protein [Marinisporobacter balticus]|uniref:DUF7973 domain-containing protein n=1 Tax=Marinisporobacter balticus TaxID=2018667 RepID=A0A4R2KXY9_9FIRM|nr:hypothetical protein [Marinisporobacter balticus]TCO77952.1 hypothetical protein EV214_10548 [Marinisporobacter balticus]
MITVEVILAAFGGGVFGALIGALPAFIFVGVMGLIGIAVSACGGNVDIVGNVAFGTLFGPHIAFAGGVAAAAYAANKKHYLESGMDILTPLLKTKDVGVLLIGGIFGILGYLINFFFVSIALPTDTPGFTVFILCVIARIIFGSTGIIGKTEIAATSEMEKRSFFPDSKTLGFSIVWSLGLGLVISYIVSITQINIIGFCISAALLIFVQMGFEFPTTHHITLVAGYATMATGNMFIGAAFAVIACVVGEIVGRTLNSCCDTHIDPPATTIFLCSFVIFIFM